LRNADPYLSYDTFLKNAADAYADPADQKNPYVFPVYANFSGGYIPTLIQGGTKEIFLSDFVRLYQALDQNGIHYHHYLQNRAMKRCKKTSLLIMLPFTDPSKVFSQFEQIDRRMTNFTDLFDDELTSEEVCGLDFCSLYLDVEYQSPYTIVLEGKLLRLAEDTIG
jgi:acetyl esterase/lipase